MLLNAVARTNREGGVQSPGMPSNPVPCPVPPRTVGLAGSDRLVLAPGHPEEADGEPALVHPVHGGVNPQGVGGHEPVLRGPAQPRPSAGGLAGARFAAGIDHYLGLELLPELHGAARDPGAVDGLQD
jgi:hypothetical protein